MKTTPENDTKKHRTQDEMIALERAIVSAIEREEPLKTIASSSGCSKTQAYHIAKRLTYGQMIVSAAERARVRRLRATHKLFSKRS